MTQAPHAAPGRQPARRWAMVACIALASQATQANAADSVASAQQGSGDNTSSRHHAKPWHTQFGMASVYARMLHGRVTASGEKHDGKDYTAAHRTLPLGTEVRVTNLSNHRSVVVRINDRGPRLKSRIIDLSPSAAAQIGLRARGNGLARVRLDVMETPPPDASPAESSEVAGMDQKRIDRASKERVLPDSRDAQEMKP